jgi:hypothetical protein
LANSQLKTKKGQHSLNTGLFIKSLDTVTT